MHQFMSTGGNSSPLDAPIQRQPSKVYHEEYPVFVRPLTTPFPLK